MSDYTIRLRAMLWWLVPLAVLVIAIAWETDWGRAIEMHPEAPQAVAPKAVPLALLPEYSIAGGTAARVETVERTLFNPTRKPAPALAQKDQQDQRMQRGQFTLTGTTVSEGKSTAFLREVSGGKSRRVQAGDTINGVKVAEVSPDRVKLTLGDEAEELVLKVAANPRPTVGPPMAAANPIAPVPPPAPVAVMPQGAPPIASGVQGSQEAQALAERRRAARSGQPVVDAVPSLAQPQAQPATTAPPAPTTPDPRWQEVYRRYQQQGPR